MPLSDQLRPVFQDVTWFNRWNEGDRLQHDHFSEPKQETGLPVFGATVLIMHTPAPINLLSRSSSGIFNGEYKGGVNKPIRSSESSSLLVQTDF